MRRGRDNGFLYDADGATLIGVNLGADFTAEHEWGIKGLHASFAIPFADDKNLGLEKRTITAFNPIALTFIRDKDHAVLYFEESWYLKDADADKQRAGAITRATKGELSIYSDGIATAWDEKSFGVHVTGEKGITALREIFEAFQRKDAAIWLGGGGVFQNAGLVLAIVSRIPKGKADGMRAADEDRIKLVARAAGTKVEETLRAAGKKWFALSPRWANKEKDGTGYDVVFWLNPVEQDIHNYGWFTVEQLREWSENKGPVMGGRRAREQSR